MLARLLSVTSQQKGRHLVKQE